MALTSDIDPIDGSEIKAIILKRIEDQLNRDSTLANDIAYPGFKLSFTINLSFIRARVEPTLVWGMGQIGTVESQRESQELAQEVHTDTYETDSPNEAREDHDLPVPITIMTPNGPSKIKVKGKAGRPPKFGRPNG